MKTLILLFACALLSCKHYGQDALTVVNWNIKNFGLKSKAPSPQVDKALLIMQRSNADIFALQEIVNTDSFQKLLQLLGRDYNYVISNYGTLADDSLSPYYAQAQKLAFVYNKHKVRVVNSRPYMASSSTAYYNFANGRLPFQVKTLVRNKHNQWVPIDFYIIHAKARNDKQSCVRRTDGAMEWKDSLDRRESKSNFILLGDFNDDLDESICKGLSNYFNFLSDSTGTHYYFSPTLAPSMLGQKTMKNYKSWIDHVFISDEVKQWYVKGSAKLLKYEVEKWVSNYSTVVSDHYPVLTTYKIPIQDYKHVNVRSRVKLSMNAAHTKLRIEGKKWQTRSFQINDGNGKKQLEGGLPNTVNSIDIVSLTSGNYQAIITYADGKSSFHHLRVQH